MVRIGVTGLMASGKSTVARRFQERGAELVEGDMLGWEVLRREPVRDAIAAAFGSGVLDRERAVDRAALGRVVFGDPASMERLNAIVQPELLRRIREILGAEGGGVRVLDAAMLTYWRLEPELDGVVEVVAPDEVRIKRLRLARGYADAEARERIRGQKLPPVRGARRHWRIENHGDRAELNQRADTVWEEITSLERAASPRPAG
jgi:dephospho-CoA kinase